MVKDISVWVYTSPIANVQSIKIQLNVMLNYLKIDSSIEELGKKKGSNF